MVHSLNANTHSVHPNIFEIRVEFKKQHTCAKSVKQKFFSWTLSNYTGSYIIKFVLRYKEFIVFQYLKTIKEILMLKN